jgi:hypothetical protein
MSQSKSIQSTLHEVDKHRAKPLPEPGANEVFKDIRNSGRLIMRIGGISDHNTFIEVEYDKENGWYYPTDATPFTAGFGDKQGYVPYYR